MGTIGGAGGDDLSRLDVEADMKEAFNFVRRFARRIARDRGGDTDPRRIGSRRNTRRHRPNQDCCTHKERIAYLRHEGVTLT